MALHWLKLHLDVSLLLAELLRQRMATMKCQMKMPCVRDIQDDPEYSAHEYWNLDSPKAASMFLLWYLLSRLATCVSFP